MRLVILESPYRAETPEGRVLLDRYLDRAIRDSIARGEAPLASHRLYVGALDDAKPVEREAGIEAGLAWGRLAEASVVYEDFGISEGMQRGIDRARAELRPVERRRIGQDGRVPTIWIERAVERARAAGVQVEEVGP